METLGSLRKNAIRSFGTDTETYTTVQTIKVQIFNNSRQQGNLCPLKE